MVPPGSAQRSLSVRRCSRISPASLVTTALAAGTIELGAGASGSLRVSVMLRAPGR
jgi:hypothetical protein